MKKLITLVLTLALCVPMLLTTSIEVKASNKCAHEKCTVTETEGNIFSDGICYACSYGNQKFLTFKPYNGWNADKHSIITSECLGCNTIITYSEGYMVGYCDISESNLVCSKCGREKEKCTHTSCANSSPEATSACNACSAEHIMEPNGVAENGHNKYVKKCAGCGFIFDADVVDDCDTNNNGACSVCGNVLGGVGTGTGTGGCGR